MKQMSETYETPTRACAAPFPDPVVEPELSRGAGGRGAGQVTGTNTVAAASQRVLRSRPLLASLLDDPDTNGCGSGGGNRMQRGRRERGCPGRGVGAAKRQVQRWIVGRDFSLQATSIKSIYTNHDGPTVAIHVYTPPPDLPSLSRLWHHFF